MSRRLPFLVLAVALALAACGGSGGTGGGGDASEAAGPSGAAPGGGDLPVGSNVIFGSAWDPATFAVKDKTPKIKEGTTPIVAVGRALAPVDGSGVKVKIEAGGKAKAPRVPDAMDDPGSAQLFAVDLSKDGLTSGTWIISFVNPSGRILASGFLTVTK